MGTMQGLKICRKINILLINLKSVTSKLPDCNEKNSF